jgi:hypothetical protein
MRVDFRVRVNFFGGDIISSTLHHGPERFHNFWKFEGPVLNCRGGTHRGVYLNELVIDEIRNNPSAIFVNPKRLIQISGKNKIVAKKNLDFLFCFPVSSGKFGKQSLRVRVEIFFLTLLSKLDFLAFARVSLDTQHESAESKVQSQRKFSIS